MSDVVVADSQRLTCAALSAALEAHGFTVVAQASDGAEAVRAVTRTLPAVLLVDAVLPGLNGVEVCAQVKSGVDQVRVAVISETARERILLAAVEAGADGYLTKDVDLGSLVDGLRRIAGGEAVVPPLMLGSLLKSLITRRRQADRATLLYDRLSRREREVLELLMEGADQRVMAQILVISPQTARTHIQNVMTKLEVHSRVEAVAFAVEHQLVEPVTVRGSA